MSNDAKASHNEVHAFVSEACSLFQEVFLTVFTLMSTCAGFPYMGVPACAHSAVPTLPCSI